MSDTKKRVLFVCIGNACRSQMAEGFARTYGSDVLIAASAGVAPAMGVPPDTVKAMEEKNVDIRDHFPKAVKHLGRAEFDVVVNMSGYDVPVGRGQPRKWDVDDPYGEPLEKYREVRDRIERLVMELIIELRRDLQGPQFRSLHR